MLSPPRQPLGTAAHLCFSQRGPFNGETKSTESLKVGSLGEGAGGAVSTCRAALALSAEPVPSTGSWPCGSEAHRSSPVSQRGTVPRTRPGRTLPGARWLQRETAWWWGRQAESSSSPPPAHAHHLAHPTRRRLSDACLECPGFSRPSLAMPILPGVAPCSQGSLWVPQTPAAALPATPTRS